MKASEPDQDEGGGPRYALGVRRVRRNNMEPRLEMTPLIDVVFLLLTFFIFSLVVMVRADILDVSVPSLTSGVAAKPQPAITVAIDNTGAIFLDGEQMDLESVISRVRDVRKETPDARLFIAADVEGRSGDLLALIDSLVAADLGDFSIVGRPTGRAGGATTAPKASDTP